MPGGHNVLMIGSPGTGKSMLAARLPTILPPLTEAESLETTRIYSATGCLPADEPLLTRRPLDSSSHHQRRRHGGRRQPASPGRDQPVAPRRPVLVNSHAEPRQPTSP